MLSYNAMLMAAGAMICGGLLLWLYGSITTSEALTENTLIIGKYLPLLKVHAHLDPDVNPTGVILVEKNSFEAGDVDVRVIGPRGFVLLSEPVGAAAVDEYFDIKEAGTYTLVIRNDLGELPVTGAIGYANESWRLALGPVGIAVLSAGTAWALVVLTLVIKRALR